MPDEPGAQPSSSDLDEVAGEPTQPASAASLSVPGTAARVETLLGAAAVPVSPAGNEPDAVADAVAAVATNSSPDGVGAEAAASAVVAPAAADVATPAAAVPMSRANTVYGMAAPQVPQASEEDPSRPRLASNPLLPPPPAHDVPTAFTAKRGTLDSNGPDSLAALATPLPVPAPAPAPAQPMVPSRNQRISMPNPAQRLNSPQRPSLGQRISDSLPPGWRTSLAPIRNTFAPFAPYVRRSTDTIRRTIAPWVPRWKAWSPQRVLGATALFSLLMGVAIVVAPKHVQRFFQHIPIIGKQVVAQAAEEPPPAEETKPRADAKLQRGHGPLSGGVIDVPESFASADGSYDVVLFFHGNTGLVEESFPLAKVNTILVTFNLGIGSGVYEERFSNPDMLAEVLMRVKNTLKERGLLEPKLRRVALAAWSAGYGAVVRLVENQAVADQVDAVLLFDGIHAAYLPAGMPIQGPNGLSSTAGTKTHIDPLRLAPFVRYAKRAVAGEKLMVITHSQIDPVEYPGTQPTTDALLAAVGVQRTPGGSLAEIPAFTDTHGVPKSKMLPMDPTTEAHSGNLHVRGYKGETPEAHMQHLIQMASIGLPWLAERWSTPKKP